MDIRNERFLEALDRIIVDRRNREGIGRLGEKLVHASLKLFYEPDVTRHEIKVDGFVCDIVAENGIVEIQTGPFTPLKRKLEALLPTHRVTVVHPVAIKKTLIWIDAEGSFSSPVKSPKKESVLNAFDKIVSLLPYLTDANLTLVIPLLEVEEYRLLHPKYGKRRSTRYERVPTALSGEVILKTSADYEALLPESLPDSFSADDFSKCLKLRGRTLSAALKVLSALGVLRREKDGRRVRYYRNQKQQ